MKVKGEYAGGRPIRVLPRPKSHPMWNTPLDGYVTPRLKPLSEGRLTRAVGFTADICSDDPED